VRVFLTSGGFGAENPRLSRYSPLEMFCLEDLTPHSKGTRLGNALVKTAVAERAAGPLQAPLDCRFDNNLSQAPVRRWNLTRGVCSIVRMASGVFYPYRCSNWPMSKSALGFPPSATWSPRSERGACKARTRLMEDKLGTSLRRPDGDRLVPSSKCQAATRRDLEAMSVEDIQKLVESLQVHQAEFDAQNEETRTVQQDLEEARDRYVDLYDFAPIGYFTLDCDSLIQEVNLTGAAQLGVTRTELVGTPLSRLVAPDCANPFHQYLRRITKRQSREVCELEFLRPDGTSWYARLEGITVSDAPSNAPRCRVITSDITDRHRTDEMLPSEKLLPEEYINSLPGLFYVFDNRRLVRWNRTLEEVTGYSPEELGTMYGTDFFEGEDRAIIEKAMLKTLQEGASGAEAELVTRDGRRIPYYFTGARKELNGRPCLVGLGMDIANSKRTEEELRENNAIMVDGMEREKCAAAKLAAAIDQLGEAKKVAEAATRSKSEFLANMSHEIRTPMTAILGFTETMLDPDQSDSEKLSAVHTVRRNGEHLLQIINDILDISRIEAGKLEVEHIRCSPIQIIADVKSLMQVRADAKNLPFNIEYIGSIPETMKSDPTRLKQILVNLVGNAIKFTETGGVRLVTRFVDTDLISGTASAGPLMQFDVIDTGIGMTQEQAGKLFQAFSQAGTSTVRKFGGTGLGLMISKCLSEMLGGDVTVESRPGEGSTFRVTVTTGLLDGVKMLDDPATVTIAESESASATNPDADKLDRRILLAEDGPDNQRLIGHVLEKAGAEVTIVENGKLAVDAALAARNAKGESGFEHPFDVIVMDMQMPVMDGYEATGQLRQKGYTGPIIALTAHAMASDRQKCIDAGCDDYTSKPIDRKKLIETIRTWTERAATPSAMEPAHPETAAASG